ncbi:glycerophosphoryl diester phosphodiesterase membrane domain-containing protein [Brevundimonas lenta]|uniref:Cold shock CspA family protein n=1 Tax=Brevundimonas lenta TaxID=424796 RepID=A0A7W6NR26_9CAUL|nr:glycerophosphoryl diester phosphodiesterase membrane domain-containing protein [Brevundimonas lenta]MBB4083735.1 cold shock CspA family protein [Brevundimonas lenta]
MRGEVLSFDEAAGEGSILGIDGAVYRFTAAAVRSLSPLERGQRVEFSTGADRQALEIDAIHPTIVTEQISHGQFDLGRVIQRTFKSIGDNAAVFFGAAVILVGLPSTLTVLGGGSALTASSPTNVLLVIVGSVLSLVGIYVLQGMVVKAAVNGFHGKKTAFGDAFDAGVRMMLPLLGLAIIAGLGTGLGMILLIVPGLILAVLWVVAAPSVVVEKRGVFESLQRSRDLTRGHRWPVFGLLMIYFVLSWVIGFAVGGLSIAAGGTFTGGSSNLLVDIITGPLVNVVSGVVASAGVAALYYELRTAKEGVGSNELLSVFD